MFVISKSEALLLGRCFQEYKEAWSDEPVVYKQAQERSTVFFLDFMRTLIRPFLPSPDEKIKEISEKDLPDDMRWCEEHGYSPSFSDVMFLRASGKYHRIWRDTSSRSLDQLIVDTLGTSVTKSAHDRISFPAEEDVDNWAQRNFETMRLERHQAGTRIRTGRDDPKAIELRLRQLVSQKDNDWEEAFDVGVLFGKLFADCHRLEFTALNDDLFELPYAFGRWKPMSFYQWLQSARANLKELLESPAFQSWSSCANLLDKERQSLCLDSTLDEEYWDVEYSAKNFVESLRRNNALMGFLSMALGELIGLSRQEDDQAIRKDLALHTPRMLKLSSKSTADKVRGSLQVFQEFFTDRAVDRQQPYIVISALAGGIEALARRIWPKSFQQPGIDGKLKTILSEKRRHGSSKEVRFVTIALSLYDSYRNPASHDLDNFDCTVIDAMQFVYSMRVLLQLSDELTAAK